MLEAVLREIPITLLCGVLLFVVLLFSTPPAEAQIPQTPEPDLQVDPLPDPAPGDLLSDLKTIFEQRPEPVPVSRTFRARLCGSPCSEQRVAIKPSAAGLLKIEARWQASEQITLAVLGPNSETLAQTSGRSPLSLQTRVDPRDAEPEASWWIESRLSGEGQADVLLTATIPGAGMQPMMGAVEMEGPPTAGGIDREALEARLDPILSQMEEILRRVAADRVDLDSLKSLWKDEDDIDTLRFQVIALDCILAEENCKRDVDPQNAAAEDPGAP